MQGKKLNVSIGIPAYNEEKNIGHLLNALLKQKTNKACIYEIIVIASGCTDETEKIVLNLQRTDRRIQLISEPVRTGKASAINLFLKKAKNKICVIVSADIIPETTTIEQLCKPFFNKNIGMTCGRPKPTNSLNSFIGKGIHLLWELHHEISLETPKCGEIIAFRKIVDQIPKASSVDEASIEANIKKKNFKIKYIPKAIIFNKGPETISEFITQRRRIHAGHLWLKKKHKYKVATINYPKIFKLICKKAIRHPKTLTTLLGVSSLEALSTLLGYYDYYVKKEIHTIWQVIKTTKSPHSN